jgi:hypothetical protein
VIALPEDQLYRKNIKPSNMNTMPTTEGEIALHLPNAGKPCKTWYKVVGKLEAAASPSLIGCDRSTRLPEKMGDESFWTLDLFVKELDNLIDHVESIARGLLVILA